MFSLACAAVLSDTPTRACTPFESATDATRTKPGGAANWVNTLRGFIVTLFLVATFLLPYREVTFLFGYGRSKAKMYLVI
jgi:hypothetical protein